VYCEPFGEAEILLGTDFGSKNGNEAIRPVDVLGAETADVGLGSAQEPAAGVEGAEFE
jgi:hypothetical protein